MELSKAVEEKYGESPSCDTLNLSYEPIIMLDRLSQSFECVKVLNLNHCHLTSLQGIEQFRDLRVLTFKFNEISGARELNRISCRSSITELNFTGNDIEHLQACRYDRLIVEFPNLTELNGCDYRFKRVLRDRRQTAEQNIQTRRVLRRLDNLTTQIPTDEDRRDTIQANPALSDISISRVEMVKSVMKADEPIGRKKQLLISTANNQNVQVYQPTATFARQKNMEQLSQNFNFKRESHNLMELLERRDEQELEGRMSHTGFPTTSVVIFPDLDGMVGENQEALADAFHFKNIERKAFTAWLHYLQRSVNMPKRKEF